MIARSRLTRATDDLSVVHRYYRPARIEARARGDERSVRAAIERGAFERDVRASFDLGACAGRSDARVNGWIALRRAALNAHRTEIVLEVQTVHVPVSRQKL